MSDYKLVIKDAFWQIIGRLISAVAGFVVITIVTKYLGTYRYGDYGTIMAYFAFWSSLSDLGLYVLGLKELGQAKKSKNIAVETDNSISNNSISKKDPNMGLYDNTISKNNNKFSILYSQIVLSRLLLIFVVYVVAIIIAYLLPAYTNNIYLIRGLPLGMFFSATFMSAGIIQLPLQLFQKMEQVSFSLIFARITQIIALLFLVFIRYPKESFGNEIPIEAFLLVFGTVCLSSIIQFIYTWIKSRKYIKLQRTNFIKFTINMLKNNWKYGVGFFLSSAPMLFVVILLSQFYPTIEGYKYTGIRALAIQLIVILLVIPPALGNSILHKISPLSLSQKQKSFGNFFSIILWIGLLILVNTRLFAPNVIYFIGGQEYLSELSIWSANFWQSINNTIIGSDIVLSFLSVVLLLSFVKQVFTYLFVATDKQNILFKINLISMIIGGTIGFFLIKNYNIIGGIITQLLFEILFIVSIIWQSKKLKISPKINKNQTFMMIGFFVLILVLGKKLININYLQTGKFIIICILLNIGIFGIWFKFLKNTAKKLVN